MIRKLLFLVALVLTAAFLVAQTSQSYSFLRDRESRPIFGAGLRPTVTAEMGIPPGTPFYDTSTYSLYYWSGSAWTATAAAGGTFASPTITSPTITGTVTNTGGLTFTAPMLGTAADNCAAVPFSFTGDTNTGVCSAAADTVGFIAGGTTRFSTSATAVTSTLPILIPDGTAGAPSLALASDADGTGTGIFRSGANAIGVSTGGTERWIFNASGALVPFADDSYTVGSSTINARSLAVSRVIQGSKTLSLTDAGAEVAFARVAVPTAGFAGGTVIYTATSTDATDQLTTTGMAYFAGVDKAGTVTCGSPSVLGTVATAYTKGNTLVCTLSAATSTTNCDLKVTCTDNTAGTQTVNFYWRLDMPISNTVAPQ